MTVFVLRIGFTVVSIFIISKCHCCINIWNI